ncbi:TPA: hypothetical protein JLC81_004030 [Escherichia coli]|nr:hypothetical protein [Escherichia coli]
MKGLENAIRNLNSLDTRMVPQASAWAILVLIRTLLRLAHMDTPSPLTLLVTRKTPSKTSHLTTL